MIIINKTNMDGAEMVSKGANGGIGSKRGCKNNNNYNNNWSCWTHSTAQKSSCLCHLDFKSDREKLTASAGILRLWQDKHICKEQILVVTSVAKSQL